MATRDVPLPLRPEQVENLSDAFGRLPTPTKDGAGTKHGASSPLLSTPKRPGRPNDRRDKTNNYFFTLLLTLLLHHFTASPSVRRNLSFEVGQPGISPHAPPGNFDQAPPPHTVPLLQRSALPREQQTVSPSPYPPPPRATSIPPRPVRPPRETPAMRSASALGRRALAAVHMHGI